MIWKCHSCSHHTTLSAMAKVRPSCPDCGEALILDIKSREVARIVNRVLALPEKERGEVLDWMRKIDAATSATA